MPERVIWGERPKRFEHQWLGRSGNWWHGSWHSHKWSAVLRALWGRIVSPTRVVEHVPVPTIGGDS